MRKLGKSILLVPVMMMLWSAPSYARNKENCKASGGKWLPGSTTDSEKGACIFTIRQGGGSKETPKNFAVGTTSAEICRARGGELSSNKSECRISMNSAADSKKLNGN